MLSTRREGDNGQSSLFWLNMTEGSIFKLTINRSQNKWSLVEKKVNFFYKKFVEGVIIYGQDCKPLNWNLKKKSFLTHTSNLFEI